MTEYTGFDALSHAVELIDEAYAHLNEHGFDDVETDMLVRAYWWMTGCEWKTIQSELGDELKHRLTDVPDNQLPTPSGTLVKLRYKKARRKWDNAGLVSAAVRKFRVRSVDENGEWQPALDDEILKVLEPAKGRTKQWRDRVFDGEDTMGEYAGEEEWVPYLDEVNPDD